MSEEKDIKINIKKFIVTMAIEERRISIKF
jgi:hypothetical protein